MLSPLLVIALAARKFFIEKETNIVSKLIIVSFIASLIPSLVIIIDTYIRYEELGLGKCRGEGCEIGEMALLIFVPIVTLVGTFVGLILNHFIKRKEPAK